MFGNPGDLPLYKLLANTAWTGQFEKIQVAFVLLVLVGAW